MTPRHGPAGDQPGDADEPRDPHLLAALAQAPDALAEPPAALSAALRRAAHDALAPASAPTLRSRWAWLDIWRQPVWAGGLSAAVMSAVVLALWWQPQADGPAEAPEGTADTRVADTRRSGASAQAASPPAAEPAPAPATMSEARPAAPPAPEAELDPVPRSAAAPPPSPKPRDQGRPAVREEAARAKTEAAAAPPAETADLHAPPPTAATTAAPTTAPPPAPAPAAPAGLSSAPASPPQLARLIDQLRAIPDAAAASKAAETDAPMRERRQAGQPPTAFAKLQHASGWRWTPPGGGAEIAAGNDAALWLQRLREAGAGHWQPGLASPDQAEAASRAGTIVSFTGGAAGPIRITLSGNMVQWHSTEGLWWAEIPPGAADGLRR